jgi:hypothetical protein
MVNEKVIIYYYISKRCNLMNNNGKSEGNNLILYNKHGVNLMNNNGK